MVWRLDTPSLCEELDQIGDALQQLPETVWEAPSLGESVVNMISWIWVNHDSLDAVLHAGPSVVILDDAGRGWRCETYPRKGPVTYRHVGSCCRGLGCEGACRRRQTGGAWSCA